MLLNFMEKILQLIQTKKMTKKIQNVKYILIISCVQNSILAFQEGRGRGGCADNATQLNKVNKWTEWTEKDKIGYNVYLHYKHVSINYSSLKNCNLYKYEEKNTKFVKKEEIYF